MIISLPIACCRITFLFLVYQRQLPVNTKPVLCLLFINIFQLLFLVTLLFYHMLVPEVFVNQPTSCHDLVTCKEMSSEGNSGSLAVTSSLNVSFRIEEVIRCYKS